jgi:hypothetical protein
LELSDGQEREPSPAGEQENDKAELAQIDRQLDRYMERWARHAIILEDGVARRLTEEEVQLAVPKSRRRRLSSSIKTEEKR